MPLVPLKCVVSGGQTGADRGALDAAMQLGIDHGGWCPKGRLAEDGTIPTRYQLRETETDEYPERTEKNVLDSDATLIIFRRKLSGGSELTRRLAIKHAKPCWTMDLLAPPALQLVRQWLDEHAVQTLNVAGPRESSAAGIADEVRDFLLRLLGGGSKAHTSFQRKPSGRDR